MLRTGRIVGLMILVCAFVQLATAHDRSEIHKRLAEVAQHVKNSELIVKKVTGIGKMHH